MSVYGKRPLFLYGEVKLVIATFRYGQHDLCTLHLQTKVGYGE